MKSNIYKRIFRYSNFFVDFEGRRVWFEDLPYRGDLWFEKLRDVMSVLNYTMILWFIPLLIIVLVAPPLVGLLAVGGLCTYYYFRPSPRLAALQFSMFYTPDEYKLKTFLVLPRDIKGKTFVKENVGHYLTKYVLKGDFMMNIQSLHIVWANKKKVFDPKKAKWRLEMEFKKKPRSGYAFFYNVQELEEKNDLLE